MEELWGKEKNKEIPTRLYIDGGLEKNSTESVLCRDNFLFEC